MIHKLRLHLAGSDPEWIIGQADLDGWDVQTQDAVVILGVARADALQTYIGVDGHATVGEFRPPPSHNVRLHLFHLAHAINRVAAFLETHPQKRLGLYASPMFQGEPMGGHLHLSVQFHDPKFFPVFNQANLLRYRGRDVSLSPQKKISVPEPLIGLATAYRQAECEPLVFTGDWILSLLQTLLVPWEYAIQPWHARRDRHAHYGQDHDIIRWGDSVRPGTVPPEWSYCHLEYRTPSTWLKSPRLAYSYLGLLKFAILNWRILSEFSPKLPPLESRIDAEKCFRAFWEHVRTQAPRYTPDLVALDDALKSLLENRRSDMNPHSPIDIPAWRRLLG